MLRYKRACGPRYAQQSEITSRGPTNRMLAAVETRRMKRLRQSENANYSFELDDQILDN